MYNQSQTITMQIIRQKASQKRNSQPSFKELKGIFINGKNFVEKNYFRKDVLRAVRMNRPITDLCKKWNTIIHIEDFETATRSGKVELSLLVVNEDGKEPKVTPKLNIDYIPRTKQGTNSQLANITGYTSCETVLEDHPKSWMEPSEHDRPGHAIKSWFEDLDVPYSPFKDVYLFRFVQKIAMEDGNVTKAINEFDKVLSSRLSTRDILNEMVIVINNVNNA